jgi:hypothetical protein
MCPPIAIVESDHHALSKMNGLNRRASLHHHLRHSDFDGDHLDGVHDLDVERSHSWCREVPGDGLRA